MKPLCIAIVLLFTTALLPPQSGTAKKPTVVESSVSQQIVSRQIEDLERRWNEAELKYDVATLESMMANDYTYTDTDGSVITKAEYLASWKAKDYHFESSTMSNIKVRDYGDTWIKKKGRWVCIATHSSKIKGQ